MTAIIKRLQIIRIPNITFYRNLSQTTQNQPTVALTKDESTYVVWHKKQDFPYEHTKPLPVVKVEETDTVLKTQLTAELLQTLNKKDPETARLELMNMTHTTKHRWFPRSRDKRVQRIPMERKYL